MKRQEIEDYLKAERIPLVEYITLIDALDHDDIEVLADYMFMRGSLAMMDMVINMLGLPRDEALTPEVLDVSSLRP